MNQNYNSDDYVERVRLMGGDTKTCDDVLAELSKHCTRLQGLLICILVLVVYIAYTMYTNEERRKAAQFYSTNLNNLSGMQPKLGGAAVKGIRGGVGDVYSPNTKFYTELDSPGNEGTAIIQTTQTDKLTQKMNDQYGSSTQGGYLVKNKQNALYQGGENVLGKPRQLGGELVVLDDNWLKNAPSDSNGKVLNSDLCSFQQLYKRSGTTTGLDAQYTFYPTDSQGNKVNTVDSNGNSLKQAGLYEAVVKNNLGAVIPGVQLDKVGGALPYHSTVGLPLNQSSHHGGLSQLSQFHGGLSQTRQHGGARADNSHTFGGADGLFQKGLYH